MVGTLLNQRFGHLLETLIWGSTRRMTYPSSTIPPPKFWTPVLFYMEVTRGDAGGGQGFWVSQIGWIFSIRAWLSNPSWREEVVGLSLRQMALATSKGKYEARVLHSVTPLASAYLHTQYSHRKTLKSYLFFDKFESWLSESTMPFKGSRDYGPREQRFIVRRH